MSIIKLTHSEYLDSNGEVVISKKLKLLFLTIWESHYATTNLNYKNCFDKDNSEDTEDINSKPMLYTDTNIGFKLNNTDE